MSLKLISGVKLRFGSMHRIWWLSVGSGCCRRALSPWGVPVAAVFCLGGGALAIFYEIEEGQTCVVFFWRHVASWLDSLGSLLWLEVSKIIQTPWLVAGHFTTLWHDFLADHFVVKKSLCLCKNNFHIFSGKNIAARFFKASKKILFKNYQDPEAR